MKRCVHGAYNAHEKCMDCARQSFERQIRSTLKTFKDMARRARKDARWQIRLKSYAKAADFEVMVVAYDAAASVLVSDYAFLKVMKRKT